MINLPLAPGDYPVWTYDIEVFPNLFLANFKRGDRRMTFTHQKLNELADFLNDPGIVLAGFNNFGYDDLIMRAVAFRQVSSAADIFRLSMRIIEATEEADKMRNIKLQYGPTPWAYSIDLFQLVNARGSLKEWQCREGFAVVEDSPADFSKPLERDQFPGVVKYCWNDVDSTEAMLMGKWDLVKLRDGLDQTFDLGPVVYRMTEAQLAQHVFVTLHERRTGQAKSKLRAAAEKNPVNIRTTFPLTEIVSRRVSFSTPDGKAWFRRFVTGSVTVDGLSVEGMDFKKPITFGSRQYQLGVGGIHSVDAPLVVEETDDSWIIDLDVTSYYPNMIINEKLAPAQLGAGFLEDLRMLKDMRVKAKREGDTVTNEALKIVINSTFGKLNDKYSPIRSQVDAHRVTVNGQLFMLMLIEMLETEGAEILSANTDGVTIRWDPLSCETALPEVVKRWQDATAMELEQVRYRKICRRDVNNYIAVPIVGKIKRKGVFSLNGAKTDGLIVTKAAEAFLLHGTPVEETISRCDSVTDFLWYQRVKNGGHLWLGEDLIGKTARWYSATDGAALKRKTMRKVPGSDERKELCSTIPCGGNARLAMDITDVCTLDLLGLDLTFYADQAKALVQSCYPTPPKVAKTKKVKS